jgi:hypothetical protein
VFDAVFDNHAPGLTIAGGHLRWLPTALPHKLFAEICHRERRLTAKPGLEGRQLSRFTRYDHGVRTLVR